MIHWCTKNGIGNGAVFVLPTDLTTCRDVLQLEATRRLATREGWRYQHVQAIIVAIDQYAEAATANRRLLHCPQQVNNTKPAPKLF
jgi:hypothetical protein